RDSNPNCEPPCPCRHKQPDPEAARQRPHQDCSSTCAKPLPAATLCRRASSRAGRECGCRKMREFRYQRAWGYGSSWRAKSSITDSSVTLPSCHPEQSLPHLVIPNEVRDLHFCCVPPNPVILSGAL